MSYKLICFDMDGTLLNSKKEISEDSLKAIDDAVKQGKTVALSTGRSLPELTFLYDKLKNVRYFICISGALIYDKDEDKIIYENNISPDIAFKLMTFAKKRDLMIHIHSFKSVVEKSKLELMPVYQMAHHHEMFKKIATTVNDIFDFYNENPNAMAKINLYHKSIEEREETKRLLEAEGYNLELAYSEISSLECSAKGVSKGTGLIKLCNHLGISVEESIAVGDADNDLEILKTCGLAVAMGNANENVKKIAKVVVADNDNGGCSEAIYKYLLTNS